MEWQQLGSTILVQDSKQMPHSSSLSISILLKPFSSFFLQTKSTRKFLSLVQLSNRAKSQLRRWRDGNITAAINDSTAKQKVSIDIHHEHSVINISLHITYKTAAHNKNLLKKPCARSGISWTFHQHTPEKEKY